jgi:hypothetical protein
VEKAFIAFNIIAYIQFKDNLIQCLKMDNQKKTTGNRSEKSVVPWKTG